VAAVTEDLAARARSLVPRPVSVIPHGLRLRPTHGLSQQAARRSLELPPDEPVVLYAGRLLRIKGVHHLLGAFPRVLARFPLARLLIVGDGEEGQDLQTSARRLGLGPRVAFLGSLPHEDVIRCMRAADVFVLPSLVESFGIVLLEAMSCGLPVVASRVMGIPYLVEDGLNGFLVPPTDEEVLADRITALLSDPDLRARMREQNRSKAAAYLMPRIADRFLDLWQILLRSKEAV
jgi:glycosyltransferase involved in cell wall biosynthesis